MGARSAAYSRWHRVALQAVLCLILAGTVGLASLVTRYKVQSLETKLARPATFGGLLSARVPEGWQIELQRQQGGAGGADGAAAEPLILRATEPAASAAGVRPRVLTIVRDRVDQPRPPLEYLITAGLMPPAYQPTLGGVARLNPTRTLRVAGRPGVLYAGTRAIRLATGEVVPKKEILATAALPSRDVLTVRLEGIGSPDDADLALVRQVAAALSLPRAAPPPPRGTGTVELPNGPTVRVPEGFVPLPETDPLRTERHLVLDDPPSRWTSVTLVACVFFPDDTEETFRSMLAARDIEWLGARLASRGGTRRADLPSRNGLYFPSRAYLFTSPQTGHALLAILHGASASDAARWDAIANALAESASAPADPAPAAMLQAGATEVARLREAGLARLLAGAPADQWWAWTAGSRAVGWSHLTLRAGPGGQLTGQHESRVQVPGRHTLSVVEQFAGTPDLAKYAATVVRRDLVAPREGVEVLRQQTAAGDGRFTTALTLEALGGQSARSQVPLPPQFLPGAYLPLLAPRLSAGGPVVLRTDRVPGLESLASTAPLNLIVRPATVTTGPRAGSTTTPATTTAATTTGPTTRSTPALSFEVSGTGQMVVVAPQVLALPGNVTRQRTTAARVKQLFPDDPTMAP